MNSGKESQNRARSQSKLRSTVRLMPKILVVDDEQTILDMLTDLLEENGYESKTARDGKVALSLLEEEVFDLMLLDILIPHINGFELIEKLSSHPSLDKVPIIVFSGIYRSFSHRNEITQHEQVVEFLEKPLKPDVLLKNIEKALGTPAPAADDEAPVMPEQPHFSDNTNDYLETVPDDENFSKSESVLESESENAELIDADAELERQEVEDMAKSGFRRRNLILQGRFENHSLAEVLGKLWKEKASGALLLRRNRIKKIIHVREGNPYNVKSNLVHECLGQLLVRERLITREQCEASILQMRDTGGRQGQILVKMHSITENNLSYALGLQFETKLFDVFSWESGEYRFNPNAELPDSMISSDWTGGAIVVEGVRRCFDNKRLQKYLDRFDEVKLDSTSSEPDWENLRFGSQEKAAYSQLQFPATGCELMKSDLLDQDGIMRMVYSMVSLRLLRPFVVEIEG